MELLFVANWKMHKTRSEAEEFVAELKTLGTLPDLATAVICPPYTALEAVGSSIGSSPRLHLGAQNIHWDEKGAHTGEIAPRMLQELGVQFSIVGHSERYQYYGERPEQVALRAANAVRNGIRPIVCVGEQRGDYEQGRSKEVVISQLEASLTGYPPEKVRDLVVAYEPVWAIGTGLAASGATAQEIHSRIRECLVAEFGPDARLVPILYGGSTTPDNIEEFLSESEISGALIGGASLDAARYWNLIARGAKAVQARGESS